MVSTAKWSGGPLRCNGQAGRLANRKIGRHLSRHGNYRPRPCAVAIKAKQVNFHDPPIPGPGVILPDKTPGGNHRTIITRAGPDHELRYGLITSYANRHGPDDIPGNVRGFQPLGKPGLNLIIVPTAKGGAPGNIMHDLRHLIMRGGIDNCIIGVYQALVWCYHQPTP